MEAEGEEDAPAGTAEAMAPVAAGCDEELARRLQEQEERVAHCIAPLVKKNLQCVSPLVLCTELDREVSSLRQQLLSAHEVEADGLEEDCGAIDQALEESRRQQQAEDARLAQALEFVELEPTGT